MEKAKTSNERGARSDPNAETRDCELCQANESLRKASAYFAMAGLDRRSKP